MRLKKYMKNTVEDSKGNLIRVGDKVFFIVPKTNKKKEAVVKKIENDFITLAIRKDKKKVIDFRFEIEKIKGSLEKR